MNPAKVRILTLGGQERVQRVGYEATLCADVQVTGGALAE